MEKEELVARCIVNPVSLFELSRQVKPIVGGFVLTVEAVATRFEGAAGTTFVGTTLLDGVDASPVPTEFVAVTVNV